MAIFNEILSGRFNRGLQKFFAIKGSPPVRQLGGEIMANVQFNQMGVDFRYLEGWNLFRASLVIGPSAANNNGVQFRNPAGSSIVAVFASTRFFDAAAGQSINMSLIRAPQVELTNVFAATSMDPRGVPAVASGSGIILSGFSPVPNFAVVGEIWSLPTQPIEYETIHFDDQETLIFPGDTIRYATSVVNTTTRFSFRWRERVLEESERA